MALKYYNSIGDTQYVLHCPALGDIAGWNIIEKQKETTISISDDITIISIMNKECIDTSPLHYQLTKSGISYLNDNSLLNVPSEDWCNLAKLDAIVKLLPQVKTKYTLILDGRDVVLLDDLNDKFISKFESMNNDIVFNGQTYSHPKAPVESLFKIISDRRLSKYLNAGVCIGKTDALIKLYNLALHISKGNDHQNTINGKPSEQYIIRKTVALTNNIKIDVDGDNKLFTVGLADCIEYNIDNDKVYLNVIDSNRK